MFKDKLKKINIPVFLLLVGTVAVGVTVAFMLKKTEPIKNQLEPAVVTCEVIETFENNQKTSITVKNTGNITAYIRVCLVSYWVNGNNEIVGKSSEMPNFEYDDSKWIKGKDDTYYYADVVSSQNSTINLLKIPLVLKEDEFNGEPVYQVVEVFAEAIQSEPSTAVENSWTEVKVVDGNLVLN